MVGVTKMKHITFKNSIIAFVLAFIVAITLDYSRQPTYTKYTILDTVSTEHVRTAKSGGGARMVLCGDVTQSCLDKKSGLAMLQQLIRGSQRLQESATLIDFDEYDHIVRSKLCKDFIIAFDKVKG